MSNEFNYSKSFFKNFLFIIGITLGIVSLLSFGIYSITKFGTFISESEYGWTVGVSLVAVFVTGLVAWAITESEKVEFDKKNGRFKPSSKQCRNELGMDCRHVDCRRVENILPDLEVN